MTIRELLQEVEALRSDGAPPEVVAAAMEGIRCHRDGLTPPAYLGTVLMDYAATRQGQTRWGTSLQ